MGKEASLTIDLERRGYGCQCLVAAGLLIVLCGPPVACAITTNPELLAQFTNSFGAIIDSIVHTQPSAYVSFQPSQYRSPQENVLSMIIAFSIALGAGIKWAGGLKRKRKN